MAGKESVKETNQMADSKAHQDREARRKRMLTEPVLPLLIRTALPTMIGMLVSMIYNLTDTFWIGRLDITEMTAAVGVVFSFLSLVQAVGFWFGYGSGNVMSRKLGAKEDEEAEIISSSGIVLALANGILLMLLSFLFIRPIAAAIGGNASEKLMTYTLVYMKTIIPAIPFSLYATTIYNQMRLCGNVKDGMTGMGVGIISNILLDPVLILGLHMEVAGAGLATTLGQVLSAFVLTWLSYHHGNTQVSLKKCNLSGGRLYHILAGGAPNFSRQGITSLASVLLNRIAAPYGAGMIAALTISGKVTALAYLLMVGFGQGFQPICAMNYGAKQYDRVRKAWDLTISIGTSFLVCAAILLYLLAGPATGLFTTDPEVLAKGTRLLRIQCFALPFLCIYAVSSMYMQNIGQYLKSLIISVSRQGLFYIPLLFLLTGTMGEQGIYYLQPLADVLSFLMALGIILKWSNLYKRRPSA